ncbi:hypothetical protein [Streptomyces sp.]|uniref:hypothetical protein n=1 Tax=Streptomyces sp. TaxID=1931 RepID=UPI002F928318
MPEAVPRQPRRDDTAADAGSLERMGRIDEQPIPAALAELAAEPAAEDPAGEQDTGELQEALAGAGVTATAADHAAMQALGQLDAATLETVTRWVQKPGKASK